MMQSMPARMVKCLYCGAAGRPWWSCECKEVQEVRAGLRPKPRTIMRDGVPIIVVDRSLVTANHLGLGETELTDAEYRKIRGLDPVSTDANNAKPLETRETEIGPANTEGPVSVGDANKPDDGGDSPAKSANRAEASANRRREYMRELMRRKREGG